MYVCIYIYIYIYQHESHLKLRWINKQKNSLKTHLLSKTFHFLYRSFASMKI